MRSLASILIYLYCSSAASAAFQCSDILSSAQQYSQFGVSKNIVESYGLKLDSKGVLCPLPNAKSFVAITIKALQSSGVPVRINPNMDMDYLALAIHIPSYAIELHKKLFEKPLANNPYKLLSVLRHERVHIIKDYKAQAKFDSHEQFVQAISSVIHIEFHGTYHGRDFEQLGGYQKRFIVNEAEAWLAGILKFPTGESNKVKTDISFDSRNDLNMVERLLSTQSNVLFQLANMNPVNIKVGTDNFLRTHTSFAITLKGGALITIWLPSESSVRFQSFKYHNDPAAFLIEVSKARLETLKLLKVRLSNLRIDLRDWALHNRY